MKIDAELVKTLIAKQFPKWKELEVRPVKRSGWDNCTFHLGDNMIVRMPSAKDYAMQVGKEQRFLPLLAPHLPLSIPTPLAQGKPDEGYPLNWSIYKWIEGESAANAQIEDLSLFAKSLAEFLIAFHKVDASNGPAAGEHSFHRGGSLSYYDQEFREALSLVQKKIQSEKALALWEHALKTHWRNKPVWVHGDISAGNLLVKDGKLSAVIDFGQLAVGDPACDLAISWTLFNDDRREIFLSTLQLDSDTIIRGKAWTLWKALLAASGSIDCCNKESQECWRIIDELL